MATYYYILILFRTYLRSFVRTFVRHLLLVQLPLFQSFDVRVSDTQFTLSTYKSHIYIYIHKVKVDKFFIGLAAAVQGYAFQPTSGFCVGAAVLGSSERLPWNEY